jgi:hypothetical protein
VWDKLSITADFPLFFAVKLGPAPQSARRVHSCSVLMMSRWRRLLKY